MIKDFVPAKANLSTGLVIKQHILERSKIARHEPSLIKIDYSGSIETAFIRGSNGLDEILNTDFTSSISSISGSITQYHTDKRELFTGELDGTVITVHSQSNNNIVYEYNNLPASSSQDIYNNLYRIPLNPILNNVSIARTTPKYLDIDYAYDPIIPVNNIYLTGSLLSNLNDQNPFLFAPVQDSNYSLYRHITPRYNGSKLTGALYNTYSLGDISYGSDPVINTNSVKFAYFSEITSQSLTLTGRSNINLKYLIDSASNVNELTEANRNLFDVQDIFNRTNANIALENINQPSKQKALNGLKPIYAGGFRYEPILQNYSNLSSTHSNIEFKFIDSISIPNPATGSQVTSSINPGFSLGVPILTSGFFNTAPGINNDTLTATINSGITFPVTRTSPSDVEIKQRITGSVSLTMKLSPKGDFVTLLYKNITGAGSANFTVTGPYQNTWLNNASTDDPLSGACNQVGSIRLEAGVKLEIRNGDQEAYRVITTPGLVTGYPLLPNNGNGLDGIRISALDNNVNFTISSTQNTFITNGNLISLTSNPGTYPLTDNDGIIITATFPYEGIITLPVGIDNANIPLRNLAEAIGNINQTFTFTRTSTSPQIKFSSIPILSLETRNVTPQYYYTQAPSQLYVTGSFDRGFLSGSGTNASSSNNWYFERGNKEGSGSQFLLMTASYDLSRLYYDHYVQGGQYYGNDIIQILPTQSLQLGYQDITENFNLKRGDLVRFYNHDSENFPFSSTFEREIINITSPTQIPGAGSNGIGSYDGRLVLEVSLTDSDSNISNQACSNNPTGSTIGHILDFIILTKVPDETNVIINHNKNPGQTSAGILLPVNISPFLKNQAGNIIKSLKSQNLI